MSKDIEVYILDGDLNPIGLIDRYVSLIWSNRYDVEGDCELYLEATIEILSLIKKGKYLSRLDDEMVCRIEKIELDTNAEEGNYITVTGYDVKKILSQRILWSQTNVDGNVEDYIRNMIYKTLVNPNLSARAIKNTQGRQNFMLGDKAGFTEVTTEQASYSRVSDKVQEFCKVYGWGYKVIVDIGNFYFVLYKGTNRSESVVFSNEYENLISTKYMEDRSNLANVALVAGEGEGSERARNVSGYAEGLDRYEIYVDARDLSKTITWEELTSMYPTTDQGGHGYIADTTGGVFYKMDIIDIAIVDNNQLTELQANYPNGQIVTKNGNRYYQVYDVIIADLVNNHPSSNDNAILRPLIYEVYLLNRGYEKLADYGTITSFDGSIEPDTTFKYKRDYFLGDLVTAINEFGILAKARITEVIEVCDDNGYRVEPKFEYINNSSNKIKYLTTENSEYLTAQNDEYLTIEGGL